MMKAMIVDDERYSVKAIMEKISWESLGSGGVAVKAAYNAATAKKIMEQETIDFIICDIEMPQTNGIELLRWIREKKYATEAIIITCHEEFEFAKEAITLGVFDYCVKPLDFQQLSDTVSRLIQKIEENRKTQEFREKQDFYEKNMVELERAFWMKLAIGLYEGQGEKLAEDAQQVQFDIGQKICPSIVCVKQFGTYLANWNLDKLLRSVENVIKGIFGNNMICGNVFLYQQNIVIAYAGGKEELWEKLSEASRLCQELLQVKVCCYIGDETEVRQFFAVYRELCKKAYDDVAYLEGVFYVQRENTQPDERMEIEIPDKIRNLLKEGRYPEFLSSLQKWQNAGGREKWNFRTLQLFQANVSQLLYAHMMELEIPASLLMQELEARQKYAASALTLEGCSGWLASALEAVERCRRERMIQSDSQTVAADKMKDYIEMHLTEELTREMVAEAVHLNVDYAARIFKQKNGMAMMNYISARRIARAAKLLKTTNLPILEVAYHAGFINNSHFTIAFRKEMGLSPSQYRKQFLPEAT